MKTEKPTKPSRYFNWSPKVIRLKVMMHVRHPLLLWIVEPPLYEGYVNICRGTERIGWNRCG